MFRKIAITALAIAVSAPAMAMSTTQLERSVGVAPGAYTLSQLTELAGTDNANERARLIRFFDSGNGTATVSRNSDFSGSNPLRAVQRNSEQ
jgi:hypothetical protein